MAGVLNVPEIALAPTANCSTCQTMAAPRIQAWPRSVPTTIAPSQIGGDDGEHGEGDGARERGRRGHQQLDHEGHGEAGDEQEFADQKHDQGPHEGWSLSITHRDIPFRPIDSS